MKSWMVMFFVAASTRIFRFNESGTLTVMGVGVSGSTGMFTSLHARVSLSRRSRLGIL